MKIEFDLDVVQIFCVPYYSLILRMNKFCATAQYIGIFRMHYEHFGF